MARTVAATIHDVLRQAATPMRVGDIHAACEVKLGRSIPRSTVKDSLWDCSNLPHPRYTRIGHGLYGLAR